MEKKKILVFGAAGFIGTYLIDELLHHDYEVVATDISELGEKYYRELNVEYVSLDITCPDEFEKLSDRTFDVVVHLAALQPANFGQGAFSPEDYIRINVNGTLNILGFCQRTGVQKIIYASSHRNTSGLWKKGMAIREEDGRAQEYGGEYAMFSISESAAQDLVGFFGAHYGMNGVIFRLPPVYGYGPHLEIFKNGQPMKTGFQTFIDNAKAGKPLEMWGDSTVGRDIIYVKDVVSALIKAIELKGVDGLYNIASGYLLTLKEEIETIARVFWGGTGKPVIVGRREKPHKMDSFLYDNSKAQRDLGWKPQFNFESMLIDYQKEVDDNRFGFLIEKRTSMFSETLSSNHTAAK